VGIPVRAAGRVVRHGAARGGLCAGLLASEHQQKYCEYFFHLVYGITNDCELLTMMLLVYVKKFVRDQYVRFIPTVFVYGVRNCRLQ
jgi:hypothetical protein